MRAVIAVMSILFASSAVADAGDASAGSPGSSFIMIGFMCVLMYLMMIRPQNKKAKEHRELMSKLKEGDEVLTASGIIGKIKKLNEQFVVLTLSEGMEVTLQRNSVAATMPKGTLKSIN